MSGFVYDDGGRAAAGYTGSASDCVCRAIAIATEKPYQEVYDALNELAKRERTGKRKKGKSSARNGVYRATYEPYILSLGWKWVPTMRIGQGCTVHLAADELPAGRLIVAVSRHLTAMIDGTIRDTHDPRRYNQDSPTRCVYGYFVKA